MDALERDLAAAADQTECGGESLARTGCSRPMVPGCAEDRQTRGTVRHSVSPVYQVEPPPRGRAVPQNAALRFAFRLRHSPASPVALARDPRPVTTRPDRSAPSSTRIRKLPHDVPRPSPNGAPSGGRSRPSSEGSRPGCSDGRCLDREGPEAAPTQRVGGGAKSGAASGARGPVGCHLVRRPRVRAAVARPP